MVTTTVATEAEAKRLADVVLHARLAACVQMEPITICFHWEGALEECREQRVACKTAASATPALMALLRKQHPYTLPQLVVQPVHASAEYGCWVDGSWCSTHINSNPRDSCDCRGLNHHGPLQAGLGMLHTSARVGGLRVASGPTSTHGWRLHPVRRGDPRDLASGACRSTWQLCRQLLEQGGPGCTAFTLKYPCINGCTD